MSGSFHLSWDCCAHIENHAIMFVDIACRSAERVNVNNVWPWFTVRLARMASGFNLHTKAPKIATLFDYTAPGMINLKMGAPGEAMLKKCAEAMKKAAVHRMVCTGVRDPPVLRSIDPFRTQ